MLEATDDWVSCIFVFFFQGPGIHFHSLTKLLCSGDFENPDRRPVSQVLKGTDDWVFFICLIVYFPIHFFSVSPSYHILYGTSVSNLARLQLV